MSERVFILDDESSVLEILASHLESVGYQCSTETDPARALERLRESPHDLLITDLRMPETSGLEVVAEVKAFDADLAVVVVTAMTDVSSAVQAMRVGADDYVLKPFNLHEISAAAANALEKRRLVIENRLMRESLEERVHRATGELERVNRELLKTKEYLESLIQSTADAIITVNSSGVIEFANTGAQRMLGYVAEELKGANIARFLPDGKNELAYLRRVLKRQRTFQNFETELLREDGGAIPVMVSLSVVPDQTGGGWSVLAICKDVTEQKRLQAELKEMSIKDSLTGLYNQRCFYDRLRSEIERSKRQRHPLSLLLFDVDQFKQYNDAHGHLQGDYVLQQVGGVVLECTRDHVDIGCRYGGDEFTVILPETTETDAANIADRIRRTFEAKGFDHLTLSIGVMAYKPEYSIRTFIQYADALMYDAKRSGGNRVYIYDPEQDLSSDFESGGAESEHNEIRHL